ncbi:Uncharacterised protein [Shigella sonnei]|nr:Uncharacterised protein [Shigella sonnei]CST24808.1 Uncharacterised protein [Shigella sonnei]
MRNGHLPVNTALHFTELRMDQRPRPGGFNRCNQPVALLCVIITNEIRINRQPSRGTPEIFRVRFVTVWVFMDLNAASERTLVALHRKRNATK